MRTTTLALAVCGTLLGPLLSGSALATGDVQTQASGRFMLAQAQQAPAPQPQAQPTPQQRAAMLKQWLQASQNQIRAYEWIETTVVSKDGEQKSSTQKRCYYGVDGKLQKVVLQQSPAQGGGPPGILPLGRIAKRAAEHQKEKMTDYMKSAAELVHSYIPPVPGLIQQSINSGKLGMQMLDPGRRARLTFGDYLKPGDSLGVDIEIPTNRLLAMAVATYLDNPQDAIVLNVTMSVLPDGTIYAARTVLDAKAKGLNVTVENTGYRRIAP